MTHTCSSKIKNTSFQFCLVFSFILLSIIGSAQSVNTLIGSRSAGVGYASATLSDEWSLFNNVGGLAKSKNFCGAFSYEASPSLPGANRMAAIFIAPSKFGVGALGFFRFGDELYSEQLISGGFSNQFGIASLGLKVNYIQYRAEAFGTKKAVSINFGGIARLTDKISVGAYISNINQPKISTQDNERVPTKLNAGASFKASEKVLLLIEIEKDLEHSPIAKGAFEYTIYKKVLVRTGFNLNPNAGFFGIGFLTRWLKVDYAIQYNQSINFSHQASAICLLNKSKEK
jgi:hypothetical protein